MNSGLHHHLDEEALWALAESRRRIEMENNGASESTPFWPDTPELPRTRNDEDWKTCTDCSSRLDRAMRQLAAMQGLPSLQTPPDFLAQVQARLKTRPTLLGFWKKRIANALAPGHGGRLPFGLASAVLMLLVLIWVFPHRREALPAIETAAPKTASEKKSDLASSKKEVGDKVSTPRVKEKSEDKRRASLGRRDSSPTREPVGELDAMASKREASDEEAAVEKPSGGKSAPPAALSIAASADQPAAPPLSAPVASGVVQDAAATRPTPEPEIGSQRSAPALKSESEWKRKALAKTRFSFDPKNSIALNLSAWHIQGDSLIGIAPASNLKSLENALAEHGYKGLYRIAIFGDSLRLALAQSP